MLYFTSSTDVDCHYSAFNSKWPGARSDHPLLKISISMGNTTTHTPVPPPTLTVQKLCLSKLRNSPVVAKILSQVADISLEHISTRLDILYDKPVHHSNLQDHVDLIDLLLTSALISAAEVTLDTYDPSTVRSKPDQATKELRNASDPTAAILLFKKAQKSSIKDNTICSRDPATPVLEDIHNYFQSIFSPPTASLLSEQASLDRDFQDYISARFNVQSIQDAISSYKSSKSSGPDPLHIVVLKAMNSCPSSKVSVFLAKAFSYYAKVGCTPSA
ncbi:hypothetical protein H4219_004961 [Mycoemilia scoparia]|uniref:Uncharacterized protein n=1 Tax=Mycoemilia scoparia TaxID=417184 RepID=A0A9W7ZQU9_9FUNG|nr:hypothetical protein H4219_004961 [Mycoemilia scoparia]